MQAEDLAALLAARVTSLLAEAGSELVVTEQRGHLNVSAQPGTSRDPEEQQPGDAAQQQGTAGAPARGSRQRDRAQSSSSNRGPTAGPGPALPHTPSR